MNKAVYVYLRGSVPYLVRVCLVSPCLHGSLVPCICKVSVTKVTLASMKNFEIMVAASTPFDHMGSSSTPPSKNKSGALNVAIINNVCIDSFYVLSYRLITPCCNLIGVLLFVTVTTSMSKYELIPAKFTERVYA